MTELEQYRRKANKLTADRRHALRRVKEERIALEAAKVHVENATKAQAFVQEIAQGVQQQAHAKIAGVVSRCLSAVFGDDAPSFEIKFEQKRGKTEARLVFVKDGEEMDPKGSSGGGCIDVASFALRLACLVLTKPSPRRLLLLDEPFRFVSKDYLPNVAQLLRELAAEMGVQMVIVTHLDDLSVGKVVQI
jgi:DNA repair exonuclease SbcCD ATPase subunit